MGDLLQVKLPWPLHFASIPHLISTPQLAVVAATKQEVTN